jgi:hypothetical protein
LANLFTEGFESGLGNFTAGGSEAVVTTVAHGGTHSVWNPITTSVSILYSGLANGYAAGTDGNTSCSWNILIRTAVGDDYIYLMGRLRGTAWGASTSYAIRYTTGGAGTSVLVKITNGSDVAFGSGVSWGTTITPDVWYLATLECNGTTINGYIQRPSDGKWLTGASTWSSARGPFQTVTDTSFAASGDSRMGSMLYYRTNGWYIDDVSFDSFGGGVTTVAGTATMIGEAALNATGTAVVLATGQIVSVSSVSAAASAIVSGAANMAGIALLTPVGLAISPATAALAGIASVGAAPGVLVPAQAGMIGVGVLGSNGTVMVIGSAAIVGASTLGANGTALGGIVSAQAALIGCSLLGANGHGPSLPLIFVSASAGEGGGFTLHGGMA